ncbi:MAG: anaerobic glycerol-3-phosphate dehydrogenase subunit B [Desulfovibrio sp.]|nr:anaerobic glycerol-3-phosphate dehydrogenase subunit B [Desulfovibrio sp.]
MSNSTDVIVIGSGLAGLMAAYAAAKNGAAVKVMSEGVGNLAISPGCIDLLGYDREGRRIDDPWAEIPNLPQEHPYSLIGEAAIRESLEELQAALEGQGLKLAPFRDSAGAAKNSLVPTIMGTFKPSWLVPAEMDNDQIQNAGKILILSIKGFRDCRPQMIRGQLLRYPGWANRDIATLVLPAPFDEHGRALNALDLAHFLDLPRGRDWLMNRIKGLGKKYDLVLMPPMLGARANSRIRSVVREELGCPYVEMLSVPPGVAGLRIRDALADMLVNMNVEFYENAKVIRSTLAGGKCGSITVHASGREFEQTAKTFVAATGGVIGGGVLLGQGTATEAVFGLEIPVPANVDEWSVPELFGNHLVSRLGVETDKSLRHKDLENVFFAGRTLGGYDYAAEKSGHGVACSTGWLAGKLAAGYAQGGN